MNIQRNTNICILLPALILSIATPLHDAEAATVTPIVVPGNPSCPAGTIDFKLESPSAGSYEVVPGKAITLSNLGNGCFDWSSPDLGIDQVIAKGGPNGNVYTYDPPPNLSATPTSARPSMRTTASLMALATFLSATTASSTSPKPLTRHSTANGAGRSTNPPPSTMTTTPTSPTVP
jgi:hypothetical protein